MTATALLGSPPRRTGVLRWIVSFPVAAWLLLARRARFDRRLVGRSLTMSDGRTYTVFRETVKDPRFWRPGVPAVLQPRFHLRAMSAGQRRRYALFRCVCIVTTPFFVGLPGFRSKLWMEDRATGDFAGLYEWDSAEQAGPYAEGLCRVLRLLSRRGSVTYELVPGRTVDEYLGR